MREISPFFDAPIDLTITCHEIINFMRRICQVLLDYKVKVIIKMPEDVMM